MGEIIKFNPLKNKDDKNVESTLRNQSEFYSEIETENGTKIRIKKSALIKFWEQEGFRKLKMPKGGYQLVMLKKGKIICEAFEEELTQTVKQKLLNEENKPAVWDEYLSGRYSTKSIIEGIDVINELNLNPNTRDSAYFFFRNGVLEVTAQKMRLISYEDFDGYVFENQIIDHDLIIEEIQSGTDFEKFLWNVSAHDVKRFDYLTSSLGYLLHGYKDSALTKAIILVDEELDFSGEANGGTGKSIIGRAVMQMTHTLMKDGKTLVNKGNRFFYQDVSLAHRVLYLDDVNKNFNFEDFYSVVTGDMTVEEKYKASYKIPFNLSPKLLITSNYMVRGSGGHSDDRRKVEIEIYPYYNSEKTPLDDFGKRIFDDWDLNEWNQFYLLMGSFCQKYLTNGILEASPINLKENKLRLETDISFVEFMDSNIVFEEGKDETIKDKAELYEAFRKNYPVESRNVTNIQFKKWIDTWSKHRKIENKQYKSNSRNMIKFFKS